MVKASVIIPTLNEEEMLPKCLASLDRQTFQDFEVIIVDSGSEDRTVEIARAHHARVVYEPRLGFAVAKNFGASCSEGKILVFTDADSEFPEDWLRRIVERFEEGGIVALYGPLRPLESKLIHNFMFAVTTDWVARLARLFGFIVAQAPNQAFRRDAFNKAGGYDERLRMLEDNELPNRMRQQGNVAFDPGVWVCSSARRYEQEGYFKATMRFLKAYWKIYFKGKAASEDYPLYR